MKNELTYAGTTFDDDKLLSMQADLDTSLSLRTLDVDQMQTTIECSADLSSYAQNSPLRFLRGGSQYELWFLQQVTRIGPKTWTLLAFSSIGRLTQMPHKGGIYTGTVTAGDLIREICGYVNGQPAAGVTVYVGAAFENTLLYGWLPYVSPSGEDGAQTGSARDNLLQVLFALNAAVRDDANGVLRVENLDTEVSSVLGADKLYRDGAKVVYDPPVTAITVLEHQWIAGSETETLFEGTTTAGQIIVFSEPMSSLDATGFTITESGANYAVLSSGSGTLTGRPYVHTTREITRAVTTAPVENTVRIEGATLVSITNSTDVASRVADYYAHRAHIEADAVIDFEDAGDVVSIYDPFDRVMRSACIEKIAPLTVSQTMKGRISALVGFTPWQVQQFDDVRELLTGSGTWTAPANIDPGTEVQVVLIGGAQGGWCGRPGEDGAARSVSVSWTSLGVNYYASGYAPRAGKGGAGGAGGDGGKIYRASITVSPGQTIVFACGVGGQGGVYSASAEVEGSPGTPTTFGTLTSALGRVSPIGYTDPVTGDVYADSGATGIAGGDGGGVSGNDIDENHWAFVDPTPSVIDEDGAEWTGGKSYRRSNTFSADSDELLLTDGKSRATASDGDWMKGGAGVFQTVSVGGGAAAGANGTNGSTSPGSYYWRYDSDTKAITGRAYAQPGVAGQSALLVPHKTQNGKGGRGGYGGGGGSGCGWAWQYKTSGFKVGSANVVASAANGGAGGDGNDGGDGGDGCIILYYRKPVTE